MWDWLAEELQEPGNRIGFYARLPSQLEAVLGLQIRWEMTDYLVAVEAGLDGVLRGRLGVLW